MKMLSYLFFFFLGFPEDHFTHLFLDEAGHATEPEAIIPLAKILSKKGQMVLAGKYRSWSKNFSNAMKFFFEKSQFIHFHPLF